MLESEIFPGYFVHLMEFSSKILIYCWIFFICLVKIHNKGIETQKFKRGQLVFFLMYLLFSLPNSENLEAMT